MALNNDEKYKIIEDALNDKNISPSEFKKALFSMAEAIVEAYKIIKRKNSQPTKKKKKKKSNKFEDILKRNLGPGLEIFYRPLNSMDLFWVMDKLAQEKESIQVSKTGYVDSGENYKFQTKRTFAAQYINLDGEKLTIRYKPGFIMPQAKAAYVSAYNSMGEHGIVVFAKPEDLNDAIDWFDTYVKNNSIFKGRMLTVTSDDVNVHTPTEENTTEWDSIVPHKEAQKEFRQIVDMVRNPKKYRQAGVNLKRGVVLAGPPGTGKTVHVKCLINDVIANGGSVIVVEGLSDYNWTLNEVYEIAKTLQPSIVILEDIDTITHNRDDEGSMSPMSVLQDLISILDGSKTLDGVITLATSNYKDRLDRALASRPGRFDVIYDFGFPDEETKIKIFDKYLQKLSIKLAREQLLAISSVDEFMKDDCISGAHIAEFCNSIIRGQLFDPNETIEDIAKNAAEQLLSISAPDINSSDKSKAGFA